MPARHATGVDVRDLLREALPHDSVHSECQNCADLGCALWHGPQQHAHKHYALRVATDAVHHEWQEAEPVHGICDSPDLHRNNVARSQGLSTLAQSKNGES